MYGIGDWPLRGWPPVETLPAQILRLQKEEKAAWATARKAKTFREDIRWMAIARQLEKDIAALQAQLPPEPEKSSADNA